jgi:hypothetical protein
LSDGTLDSWYKNILLQELDKEYGKIRNAENEPQRQKPIRTDIPSFEDLIADIKKKGALSGKIEQWKQQLDQYPDYSEQMNDVIKKCILEFNPNNSLFQNFAVWKQGVFNQWDFVGDTWWFDKPDQEYKSYIPKDIQGSVKSKNDDYFVVNGHVMNREQFGNYVKGATAAACGIPSSLLVDIAGIGQSIIDNVFDSKQGYHFDWANEMEDTKFTDLGYSDMINGSITGNAGYYEIVDEIRSKEGS